MGMHSTEDLLSSYVPTAGDSYLIFNHLYKNVIINVISFSNQSYFIYLFYFLYQKNGKPTKGH